MDDAELNQLAEEMALNVERMRNASQDDVIAAMVECGCPKLDAERQFQNTGLEGFARQFYLDYLDSKLGNKEATDRLERVRQMWGTMTKRKEEQE